MTGTDLLQMGFTVKFYPRLEDFGERHIVDIYVELTDWYGKCVTRRVESKGWTVMGDHILRELFDEHRKIYPQKDIKIF